MVRCGERIQWGVPRSKRPCRSNQHPRMLAIVHRHGCPRHLGRRPRLVVRVGDGTGDYLGALSHRSRPFRLPLTQLPATEVTSPCSPSGIASGLIS
jgi:hypothetical protein